MATCRQRVAFSTIARWNGEMPVRSNAVKSQPEHERKMGRGRRGSIGEKGELKPSGYSGMAAAVLYNYDHLWPLL